MRKGNSCGACLRMQWSISWEAGHGCSLYIAMQMNMDEACLVTTKWLKLY